MGLPAFLAAFGLGLAIAPYLSPSSPWLLAPVGVALLWALLRRRRFAGLLLGAFFLLFGISLSHLHLRPPSIPGHISSFVGEQPVTIEGSVLTSVDRAGGKALIDLEATRVGANGIAAPASGTLRIYVDDAGLPLAPGDRIRFRSRLRAPRPFGTPGEFSFARHLAGSKIFATAFVSSASDIAVFPAGPKDRIHFALQRLRLRVAQLIDKTATTEQAPLVKALVIGEKNSIPATQRSMLARGGVAHLFSISGFHFGMVCALLYALCRFGYCRSDRLLQLGPPRRYLPLMMMPLLLGYLIFTGGALPTRRAFFMILAGALLLLLSRRTSPIRALLAAAFLILVFDPLALYQPSFQLSCAGLLGILVWVPRWQSSVPPLPGPIRHLTTLLLTTLAATLATAPLALVQFHALAPAGLITNLAAVPLIGLVAIPLGLGGALLTTVWPPAAGALFFICAQTVRGLEAMVDWALHLPGMGGWTLHLSPVQTGGVFLLVGLLLLPLSRLMKRPGTLILLAASGLLLTDPFSASGNLRVIALSVGQGDATLLSLPDGRHFLIDGGGLRSDTFDVGERLVAPALGRLGVHELEAVILTHDHPDHSKGLGYILEHFPVKAFWSAIPAQNLNWSLHKAVVERNIPRTCFAQGWTALEDSSGSALALYVPPQGASSANDRSLAVYARTGKDAVLLTGDLETEGITWLLKEMPDQAITLLKVPHHGSRHSSPGLLAQRLTPQIAFISAGYNNSYGLPHPEVVSTFIRNHTTIYRTDLQGTLRFLSDGSGWRASSWQKGLFR